MNQHALWADPNVRLEHQARAEAFMGRPMEFDEECAEMKSSKDIPPRVGMQVDFMSVIIAITSLGRDGFEGIVLANELVDEYDAPGDRWVGGHETWNNGNYSITWTPPSDDERRLFMDAARHWRRPWQRQCEDGMPCDWGMDEFPGETKDTIEVFESLALDGADYDNMPDFEELER